MRFCSLAAGVGVLIVTALGLGAAQTGSHVEQQRLIGTATGGNILVVPAIRTGDQFGTALAVDDDTAVVGVPGDDVFFSTSDTLRLGWRSGAAYVFTRNGLTGRWRELQKLFPLDPVPARQFGTALAIDGDRLVIGDPESRIAASRGGAVYVFQRDPATARWEQIQVLTAAVTNEFEGFGSAVALHGDTILVGSLNGVSSQGAAYFFTRGPANTWQQRQKVTFPVYGFGSTVALDDGLAIVGAPQDSTNGRDTGSAFAYRFDAATARWELTQRLFALEAGRVERANLDGSGVETVVSGPPGPRGLGLDPANGKMYWTMPGLGQIRRANLDGTLEEDIVAAGLFVPQGIALDAEAAKMYWTTSFLGQVERPGKIFRANLDGGSVEELADTGLFPADGIALDPARGKMYWADLSGVVRRANLDGTTVELIGPVGAHGIAVDPAAAKLYWTDGSGIRRANLDGSAVEDLVVGVFGAEGIALDLAGGFVYWTVPGLGTIQRARLDGTGVDNLISGLNEPVGLAVDLLGNGLYWTTPGVSAFDSFGAALAIDGRTLIVGTASFLGRGAAHAFRFDAASRRWEGRQRLTGSDVPTIDGDGFGASLGLDGDTLVVGASIDDAKGFQSGAAYLFRRDTLTGLWGERQRLDAADAAEEHLFGAAVAAHGGGALIGAPGRPLSAAVPDAGLVYVFGPEADTGRPEPAAAAIDGPLPSGALPLAGQTLAFGTGLRVLSPGGGGQHARLLTQCQDVTFSVAFNQLDAMGAPFRNLVGELFSTTLLTGPWFDGSSSVSILRRVEAGDAGLRRVEFHHGVPCSARLGTTAFTAIQAIAGFAATGNSDTRFSFVQPFQPDSGAAVHGMK